jgi:hypothetical protein
VRAGLCKSVAAAFRGLPASRCIALLADVPDGQRRDGPPQFVIWRKHPVLAMPVLPRRRDKVRQTIEADISAAGPSLAPTALGGRSQSHGLAGPPHRHPAGKRREFDDTVGSRPRGLPPTAPPDPVGGFVPREHVADASDPAVRAADHGEPFEREGRPYTVSEKMLETPKIARHVAFEERDPDAGVDREPAVLLGNHVGGGRGVEEASEPEPADHAAAYPLGERGQVCGGDWPGRQERRRCVTPCLVSSRHEDAVGHARVEVDMMVERRAEAEFTARLFSHKTSNPKLSVGREGFEPPNSRRPDLQSGCFSHLHTDPFCNAKFALRAEGARLELATGISPHLTSNQDPHPAGYLPLSGENRNRTCEPCFRPAAFKAVSSTNRTLSVL